MAGKAEKENFSIPKTPKDFQNYTLEEIESLARAAKKVIETRSKEQREKSLNTIVIETMKHQFSLEEIVTALVEKGAIYDKTFQNGVVQRIYENPNKPFDIYVGSGRHPDWLREQLALGAKIEDFEMFKDVRESVAKLDLANKVIDRCSIHKGDKTVAKLSETGQKDVQSLLAMADEDTKILETKAKADAAKTKRKSAVATKESSTTTTQAKRPVGRPKKTSTV